MVRLPPLPHELEESPYLAFTSALPPSFVLVNKYIAFVLQASCLPTMELMLQFKGVFAVPLPMAEPPRLERGLGANLGWISNPLRYHYSTAP